MIRIAGSPARLRPHCKTHKMREVIELELARGIAKHKCATIAEAEMLAEAGVKDIFLAYNPVGPNIGRVVPLRPEVSARQARRDGRSSEPDRDSGDALAAAGQSIEVLLDIDCGQHRTGVPVGAAARWLYEQIARTEGLTPGGFHLYDGHNHQKDVAERRAAVHGDLATGSRASRSSSSRQGLPVPRIVAGGTGSFPIFAAIDDPAIELSPGTIVFHDWGYSDSFPDLAFTPAALLLTRVISRPTDDRVTLDLGYKAVASDPPAGNRVMFPDLPDAKAVLQNEEHLVLETSRGRPLPAGRRAVGIPRHICPTCALHKQVYVVSGGRLIGTWAVAARDRKLTI